MLKAMLSSSARTPLLQMFLSQNRFQNHTTLVVTHLNTLSHFLALFTQTCLIMRANEKFFTIIPYMLGLLAEYLKDLFQLRFETYRFNTFAYKRIYSPSTDEITRRYDVSWTLFQKKRK